MAFQVIYYQGSTLKNPVFFVSSWSISLRLGTNLEILPLYFYLCMTGCIYEKTNEYSSRVCEGPPKDYYYVSGAALFDDPEVQPLMGMAYKTFRKHKYGLDEPYENEYVIVKRGVLLGPDKEEGQAE